MRKLALIMLSGLALIGCGESAEQQARMQDQKIISELKNQLAAARDSLDARLQEREQLVKQTQELTDKIAQQEKTISAKAEEEKQKPAKGKRDESRIELMGAKAIAEFKAGQLDKRVEKLTQDLDRKEQEVASIRKNAQLQAAEVEQLREKMAEFQKADQGRTGELQAKLEAIGKELNERAASAERFKRELDEKAQLLDALKNAVSDASKLKTAAETEVTKLRDNLDQTLKQLENTRNEAEQARQETAKYQDYIRQLQEGLEQWRHYGEQMKQETDRLGQQLTAASAEISQLREQLKAAQERIEELSPSAVDRIIGGPEPKEQNNPG